MISQSGWKSLDAVTREQDKRRGADKYDSRVYRRGFEDAVAARVDAERKRGKTT